VKGSGSYLQGIRHQTVEQFGHSTVLSPSSTTNCCFSIICAAQSLGTATQWVSAPHINLGGIAIELLSLR